MTSGWRTPCPLPRAGVAAGVLAAALATAGCEDADPGRGPGRPDEVAAARSSAAGGAVRLEARWLVPPDPSGEPPLAAPVALAVDEERGRLLLLETQPPELRLHDLRDGRYLGTLGRGGDGPGEYRNPIGLAVGSGGRAAVLSTSGRVTFWDADDVLAGTVQAGPGMATDIVAACADSFYVKTDRFPPDDVAEFRVVAVDRVLGRPMFRDSDVPGTAEPGRPVRNHAYAVAGTLRGDLLLAPPGPAYTILRIDRSGEVTQVWQRPEVAPLARSEEEIEAVRERVRKAFAALGRAAPTSLRVPTYRSHVARLAVAPEGSVWALTQRGDSSSAIIDRFDAAGEFTGSFAVALRAIELAVSSEAIYLLARGPFDVPGVAVAGRPGR